MDESVKHVFWEPGNGTRYELVLAHVEGNAFGYGRNVAVVSGPFPDKIRTMIVPLDRGTVLWFDVAEIMGLNEHDASVVAEIIAGELGLPVEVTREDWYRERVRIPYAEVLRVQKT